MRVRSILAAALGAVTALALLGPVPAAAADPHLRGRVTDAAGDGVEDVCVDVHPADSLAEQATYTTGADGRWTASPSEDRPDVFGGGRYRVKVEFRDCDGTANGNLAGEWHADVPSFDLATEVLVDPGAADPQRINATLAPGGAVSGRVVDDGGGGVGGACVGVTDPDDPSVGNDTVASGNGTFTVVGLRAGSYVVKASDCDAPRTQASAYLGPDGTVARGADDAARVAVAAGDITTIGQLRLPDAGALRGTIRSSGGPVDEACVTAVDADSNTTVGAVTGADGVYVLRGLLPGDWLLRVADCLEPSPAAQFATTFLLPDGSTTTDPALAADRPFGVGSRTLDVGTRSVTPGGAISGRAFVDGDTTGLRPGDRQQAFAGACVSAVPRGSLRIAGSDVADGNGRWVIGGLDPDTAYRFAAYDCAGNAHGLDWAAAAPAEGQAVAYEPNVGVTSTGVDVTVGDALRRVAGQTRVDTATRLALDTFRSAETVILARQDAYPDALAGAPLATLLDAPILLTDRNALSPGVATTIRRLGADRVILLGLEVALSPTVEDQVAGIDGVTDVRRVGGQTRFDTAAMIAGFVGGDRAYVVEGSSPDPNRGWPDAVSVAGLAARTRAPLLLVERDRIPDGTRTALEGLGFDALTAIGGPVAISDGVYGQLAGYTTSLDRLAGGTRYATSAAVVERALDEGLWSRTMWVATGQNYPDALVTGAIVGQDGGLLQLVAGSDATASPEALATLADLADTIDRTVLLGGEVAISESSADAIGAALGLG